MLLITMKERWMERTGGQGSGEMAAGSQEGDCVHEMYVQGRR